MENDKELDNICEAYLTQRLYSSRVPLSDGFMAALTKEFQTLKKDGYSVDRILKKIVFELKNMNSSHPKQVADASIKAPEVKDTKLPEKAFKEVLKSTDRGI